MTRGEVGWCIALAGLPFAYLLRGVLRLDLDVWHFQTAWMQVWIMGLFTMSLWQGKLASIPRPLILWLAWLLLHVWWVWNTNLVPNKAYPMPLLVPMTHIIILLMAFLSLTWSGEGLQGILRTLRWLGVVVLGYCLLQMLNLDEFFKSLNWEKPSDELVGPIGNQTFLAAYLGILLPLYLFSTKYWRMMAAICLGMIGWLAWNYQSATGVLVAVAGLLWWTTWQYRWWAIAWVPLLLGGVWWSATHAPDLWVSSGRIAAWTEYWQMFQANKPTTGLGLGAVRMLSEQIEKGPLLQWRHLHNEFYQVAVEQGMIGFGLMVATVVASVRQFFRLERTDLSLTLGGMWLAFLLTSLTLFPAHLWTLGSLGLVAYGGLYALTGESV